MSLGAVLPLNTPSGAGFLRPLLFSPALVWMLDGLKDSDVADILVVATPEQEATVLPLLPEGVSLAVTSSDSCPQLEDFFQAHPRVLLFSQPLLFLEPPLWEETDQPTPAGVAAMTQDGNQHIHVSQALPLLGDDPLQWLNYQATAQAAMVHRLLAQGVHLIDPSALYLDPTVTVGAGTTLLPGTILRGKTTIGANCTIGPNTMIRDCTLGDYVTANAAQLNESVVESGVTIGPFAYIRPNCHIGAGVKVGDFVEVKNATVGEGTKIPHLTYVGDADVGAHVNFGCGTVFVNYNGAEKFRSTVGDNAFIGCNTNLVSPVNIGAGVYTAAGSTITQDVPADNLAIARARQVNKDTWARPVKAKK